MKIKIILVLFLVMASQVYGNKTQLVPRGVIFPSKVLITPDRTPGSLTLNINSMDPSVSLNVYSGPFQGGLNLDAAAEGLQDFSAAAGGTSGNIASNQNAWTDATLIRYENATQYQSLMIKARDENSMKLNAYSPPFIPNPSGMLPGALGINIHSSVGAGSGLRIAAREFIAGAPTYNGAVLNISSEVNQRVSIYPHPAHELSPQPNTDFSSLYIRGGNLYNTGTLYGDIPTTYMVTDNNSSGAALNFGTLPSFFNTNYSLYAICVVTLRPNPNIPYGNNDISEALISDSAGGLVATHTLTLTLAPTGGTQTTTVVHDRASLPFVMVNVMISGKATLVNGGFSYSLQTTSSGETGIGYLTPIAGTNGSNAITDQSCVFWAMPEIVDQ